MLISIASGTVGEYHGTKTPAGARLYANKQFSDSTAGRVIPAGSIRNRTSFYQPFSVSVNGSGIITIEAGDAYSTVDSSDPMATYTLVIVDANGREIVTLFTNLRIPENPTSTTWDLIRLYSVTRTQRYAPTYVTTDILLGMLNNYQTAVLKADTNINGILRITTPAADPDYPTAVSATDPRVNTVNAGLYDTFAEAVDAAVAVAAASDAGTATLEVTTQVYMFADQDVPEGIFLKVKNTGLINLNGHLLTPLGGFACGPQLAFLNWEITPPDLSQANIERCYFEWYGIFAGANNSAAMQALIDARAGALFSSTIIQLMPETLYSFSSPLNINSAYNIAIVGGMPGTWGGKYCLRYTGSGASSAITFKSHQGFTLHGVCIEYTNAGFSGFLLESGHAAPTNADATFKFSKCFVRGNGAYGAAALISGNLAIDFEIVGCQFAGAFKGIEGFNAVGASRYNVSGLIMGNEFNDCGYAIYQAGENWVLINNRSEPVERDIPSLGIKAGENRFYGGRGDTVFSLVMIGNWLGDVTATDQSYSHIDLTAVYGCSFIGNRMYSVSNAGLGGVTTCVSMNACHGIDFGGGNVFEQADRAMSYYTANSDAVNIGANHFGCLVNDPVSVGGIIATGATRIGTSLNTFRGSVRTYGTGSGLAPIAADATSIIIGCYNGGGGATDSGLGGAFRMLQNVSGRSDGDGALQVGAGKTLWIDSLTKMTASLLFGTDNTNDIGAVGATRPRTGYFGTSVIVPDDAYDATNWNGSNAVPTKNAVRDKFETVVAAIAAMVTGATPAEIDRFNDVSAYQESITAAGALSISKKYSGLALSGAGAVTLAAPDATMLGQIKLIEMTADNGDVTLSLTNVVGQSSGSTATFNDVGDSLVLIARSNKWVVLKEQGITLS